MNLNFPLVKHLTDARIILTLMDCVFLMASTECVLEVDGALAEMEANLLADGVKDGWPCASEPIATRLVIRTST